MPNKEIKKTTATKKATEKKVAKKKSTIAMPKEEVKVVESAKKKAATKKKVATPLAASVKNAPAKKVAPEVKEEPKKEEAPLIVPEEVLTMESKEAKPLVMPESVKKAEKKKKKHSPLFSWALFKESLKSRKRSLIIASAGNVAIMVILIGILSTLNVNSTANALRNLFNNADTETTIKSGAISYYSAFKGFADADTQFSANEEKLQAVVGQAIDHVNDATLNSQINTLSLLYNVTYRLTNGDDATKAQTAKNAIITAAKADLNGDTSKSEEEKEIAIAVLDAFYDVYGQNKASGTEESNAVVLKKAIPTGMSKGLASLYTLDEKEEADVLASFQNAFTKAFGEGTTAPTDEVKAQAEIETAFTLIKLLSQNDENSAAFVAMTVDALQKVYTTNVKDDEEASKTAYIVDHTLHDKTLANTAVTYAMETVSELAYYQFLPSFTVEYKTSDLGYPITYVPTGEYDEDGEAIYTAKEIKVYNPDVYVKVDAKMGTDANMAQKMHKDVLTGEDYDEETVSKAKEEAADAVKVIEKELHSFADEFIARDENNQNTYYDGSNVLSAAIEEKAVDLVSKAAEQQVVDSYNESHKRQIVSAYDISGKDESMSGKEMMDTVRTYAYSGIASYNSYLASAASSHPDYTLIQQEMIAITKGGLGIIDQLPTLVGDSLSEMGNMNTYGIIVGSVGFGIACLLIPMVYTILTATDLVASKVESGSLAFTLSTPTPRKSFIFTEMTYLLFTEFVMGASLLLAAILTQVIGIACGSADLADSLPIKDICYYALGNFLITIAISGINFLTSSWANKTNNSIGVGGGITIFFFICAILGLFGTEAIPATVRISGMSFFNYITVTSCFDAVSVMHGDMTTYWWKILITLGIALATYAVGFYKFTKKDLPL